jgi:hypothetical protein
MPISEQVSRMRSSGFSRMVIFTLMGQLPK